MVANCLTRNNYEKKVKEYSEFFKSLRGIAILIKMSVDLGRLQMKIWIKERGRGGGVVKNGRFINNDICFNSVLE